MFIVEVNIPTNKETGPVKIVRVKWARHAREQNKPRTLLVLFEDIHTRQK